jgi:hypothetical protein
MRLDRRDADARRASNTDDPPLVTAARNYAIG